MRPECACLHKTVNMVVFFVQSNENAYPKGRAIMQTSGQMSSVLVVPEHGSKSYHNQFTLQRCDI